jgi:hypothetical protein
LLMKTDNEKAQVKNYHGNDWEMGEVSTIWLKHRRLL